MALEIERKFLVNNNEFTNCCTSIQRIRQGYLNLDIDRTVQIRTSGDGCYLTIKGRNRGSVRQEFEYKIPEEDAFEMLKMCLTGFIDKNRYIVPANDLLIEVDVFAGDNAGLVVAEIEFSESDPRRDLSEGELQHHLPEWIGKEVTDDSRYYNSSLLINPFRGWNHKKIIKD